MLLLVVASWTTANPTDDRSDSVTDILIVGDSISAGYGMEVDESWPALLEKALRADGYSARIKNVSVSGETTGGALGRLPRALQAHTPDLVVIELGGNDGLRGFRIQDIKANLLQMVHLCQAEGAQVAIASMELPPNYGPDYINRFKNIYREVSRLTGAKLIPFTVERFTSDRSLMMDDGIHPSVKAQPLIVELVMEALVPMLRKLQEQPS